MVYVRRFLCILPPVCVRACVCQCACVCVVMPAFPVCFPYMFHEGDCVHTHSLTHSLTHIHIPPRTRVSPARMSQRSTPRPRADWCDGELCLGGREARGDEGVRKGGVINGPPQSHRWFSSSPLEPPSPPPCDPARAWCAGRGRCHPLRAPWPGGGACVSE